MDARRREVLAFLVFCLVNLLVPLFVVDLFPFSRAPMFADAPREFCTFRVTGPDGKELPARDFALQRNYWGNPLGVGCGFRPPASFDRFGTRPTDRELLIHVQDQLVRFPQLPFVDITLEVTGPTVGSTVGVVERSELRVVSPHHRVEAGR